MSGAMETQLRMTTADVEMETKHNREKILLCEKSIQKISAVVFLLFTLCFTLLVTMPGGYFDEPGKTSPVEKPMCASPTTSECSSSPDLYKVGEAKTTDSFEFKVIMYGSSNSIYISMFVLAIYLSMGSQKDVKKWKLAFYLCTVCVCLCMVCSIVAIHFMMITVLGHQYPSFIREFLLEES